MSKKYKAIFFDWDGTAVMSRQAPVEEAVAAMKPLLASGVKLVIVSGTTYDKIASGKIHEHFTPEEASNLYLGLGRGAYNYKMVNGQPEIFADCIPDTEGLLRRKIMKIIIANDYEDMSRKAANYLSAQVIMKPDAVLGLATGETPIGAYKQLVEWYNKGDIDFSQTSTINLDEYKGLTGDHKQSYRYFMDTNLFDLINIKKSNTYLPNGMAEDEEAECARYEGIMKQLGNIDMQLLGIGLNGHIGFNEPGESFEKTTHCVQLTQSTIDANQRLFDEGEAVPEKAFTMGIKSIMQSKHILLIANGEKKAQIIRDAFFGPVTPKVPASILQLHNNVTVIVDKEAGKLIKDVL